MLLLHLSFSYVKIAKEKKKRSVGNLATTVFVKPFSLGNLDVRYFHEHCRVTFMLLKKVLKGQKPPTIWSNKTFN